MKKSKDDIMAALDAEYISEKRELAKIKEKINLSADGEEDYNDVREMLKSLITKSNVALDDLLELARENEHPRTYEVLANLIKTTGEVGEQLIGLQKTRHELDKLNNPDKAVNTGGTTNNVFIGSTAELQKFLKNEQEKIIDVQSE
jgi:hypothetical protein